MTRVLICGGRDYSDYLAFTQTMNALALERGPFTTIIHGAAKGADWCAHLYATSGERQEELSFPADWHSHGKAAGPIRNARMIREGRPDLVIAFPGGKGTADCVRQAREAGIEVIEVPAPATLPASRRIGA